MGKFEDLEVWKRAARLSADLFKSLYSIKDFGFRDQITRAGMSIPSNIAEGYERLSNKEKSNFLNYAKGSAGELRTQIYIGSNLHRHGHRLHRSRPGETAALSCITGI